MKDISVIMPSCNEYPLNALTAFNLMEELRDYDYEIIVIGNRCTDHTRNFFDAAPPELKDQVRYLEYNESQSHWQAKNHGVAESSSRLLFFPDAHIIMSRDGLRDMITFIDEFDGKIGSVHPRIRWAWYGNGEPLEWFLKLDRLLSESIKKPDRKVPGPCTTASTCGMLMRRAVFEECGGFNKYLGGYPGGGEVYIIIKNALLGYPAYIHHTAYFWHVLMREHKYTPEEHTTAISRGVAGYALGGEALLDDVIKSLESSGMFTTIDFTNLRQKSIKLGAEDRLFIESNQVESLESYLDKEKSYGHSARAT